jgi:hypothetical protein
MDYVVASFLSRRLDHNAQLIADIADAYAIPEEYKTGYRWMFHDGSSVVLIGKSGVSFDANGIEMHRVTFESEVSITPNF